MIDWSKYGGTPSAAPKAQTFQPRPIDWNAVKNGATGAAPKPARGFAGLVSPSGGAAPSGGFASLLNPPTDSNGNPISRAALGVLRSRPVQGLLDLLARPGNATQEAIVHGPGAALNTLIHGNTSAQQGANLAQIRHNIGLDDPHSFLGQSGTYANAPHWAQGLVDAGLGSLLDPTTYLGGAGLIRKGVQSLARRALPAVMTTATKAAKAAPISALPALQWAAGAGGEVHDFLTPGGRPMAHAMRSFAASQGPEGIDNFQRLYSLQNASQATSANMQATLRGMYQGAIKGLTPPQEMRVYRALHYGRTAQLPNALQPVAAQIKQVTDSIAYLRGTGTLRDKLTSAGFQLPQPLQGFDRGPLGVQNTSQYMENYLPLQHNLEPNEAQALLAAIDKKRGGRDLASLADPRLKKRLSDEAIILSDPQLYRDAFNGAIRSGSNTAAAADLRNRLAQQFAPETQQVFRKRSPLGDQIGEAPPVFGAPTTGVTASGMTASAMPSSILGLQSLLAKQPISSFKAVQRYAAVPKFVKNSLKPDTVPDPTRIQQALDFLGKAANVGKATLFTTPTPHMKNIATLLATAKPSAVADAFKTFAQLKGGFANPGAYHDAIGDAVHAGASGVPNVEQSQLVTLLQKLENPVAQNMGRMGFLAHAPSKLYETSGKMLWGFDDAAKAALYRQNLTTYKDPLIAAYHTQKSLVDYHNISPLTQAARTVAPFATWRTTMPFAVMKSLAENPQNALALNRLTGGAYGGTPWTNPQGRPARFISPISETSDLGALSNPQGSVLPGWSNYGRGSLSLTMKLLADMAGVHPSGYRGKNWATYGIQPPNYIPSQLPVLGQMMQLTGHGPFKQSPRDALLYLLSGVETSK